MACVHNYVDDADVRSRTNDFDDSVISSMKMIVNWWEKNGAFVRWNYSDNDHTFDDDVDKQDDEMCMC